MRILTFTKYKIPWDKFPPHLFASFVIRRLVLGSAGKIAF
jgi:hypothetical protein